MGWADTYKSATDNTAGKLWNDGPIGGEMGAAATASQGGNPLKGSVVDTSGGPFGPGDNLPGQATAKINDARDQYQGLTPPSFTPLTPGHASQTQATATDAAPTAYSGITTDPANSRAQQAQMAALSNLAANGGRNAASDNNLAQIQNAANQNARGQQDAIMANMNARGQGNSGNSLLAQLSNSQNATNNQSAQDSAVAGQQANTALQAGQGAAAIGSNLENQQFGEGAAKAGAADAVSKFNAQNQTGVSQYNAGQANQLSQYNTGADNQAQYVNNFQAPQQTYQDQATKAQGIAGADQAGATNLTQQNAAKSSMLGSLAGGGIGAAGSTIAAFAAGGGRIPGQASVPGNSFNNDTVPAHVEGTNQTIMTSPDEVIVPRDLAQHGSKSEIGNFVKNPPPVQKIGGGDKNKEAMLAALKHLGRK